VHATLQLVQSSCKFASKRLDCTRRFTDLNKLYREFVALADALNMRISNGTEALKDAKIRSPGKLLPSFLLCRIEGHRGHYSGIHTEFRVDFVRTRRLVPVMNTGWSTQDEGSSFNR